MENESVSAATTIEAPAEDVFAVLTDPSRHAGIDGTGWVSAAVDTEPISSTGSCFRMSMLHSEHPDGAYETVNEVVAFEPGRTVAWRTGYVDDSGELAFGGWWWRYDLSPLGPRRTRVTLTYDWSAVGPGPREYLTFPVFPGGHLERSLQHLAQMLTSAR